MTRRIFAFAFLLLLAPSLAQAKEQDIWSFLGKNIPGRWEIAELSNTVPTEEGLMIQSDTDGRMARPGDLPFPVEAMRITVNARKPVEGILLWHVRNSPPTEMVQLPFAVSPLGDSQQIDFPLKNFHQWDPMTDRIGFAFPAGTEFTLQTIEFYRWNPFEKFFEALKSFWTMDEYRPYSINFLWGPRIAWNPIARTKIFQSIPPTGWSVNRLFLALIALGGATLWAYSFREKKRKGTAPPHILAIFFTVFAAFWIFYDFRMGTEFISYLVHDIRTSWNEAPAQQEFRERDNFYAFAEAALPFLQDRPRYLFMTQHRWPFLGAIRYLSYPSIPVDPTETFEDLDTVIVFDRPDISVNEQGQLSHQGTTLSTSGQVLLQFDQTSFVFRANP